MAISILHPSTRQFMNNLDGVRAIVERSNRQITSGLRVGVASDDPGAVADILDLQSSLSADSQFTANLNQVKTEADRSESVLAGTVQLMDEAIKFGAQGASTLGTAATRQTLAAQVRGIMEQMIASSNQQVNGRYLFSGDSESTPLYSLDLTQPNGVALAQVVTNTRSVADPRGGAFMASRTAPEIFDDPTGSVFGALNQLRVALINNTGIDTALGAMHTASDALNAHQAFYGGVQNRVTGALDAVSKATVQHTSELSVLRDTDMTEAILELNAAQTQQAASLQAWAKTPPRSLFDYLG